MRCVFKSSVELKRLVRPLTSFVVAYALAIQSVLIAVGGFSPSAGAAQGAPAFELCLHDISGAPALPADKPDLSDSTHCVFCFAGAHHAMVGAAPADFHRVKVAMVVVPWHGDTSVPVRPARHAIASPRGPPFSA
jgi:hypothetical protein